MHTPHRAIRTHVYVYMYKPIHACAFLVYAHTYVHTSAVSELKAKWDLGVKTH